MSIYLPYSRLLTPHSLTRYTLWYNLRKWSSSNYTAETDDGAYFVCWHAEKKFPYEFTRPIPQPSDEYIETQSPLKMQNPADVYDVFQEKSPELIRQELMKITYTTKHRWFPRPRDKYAKKTPRDREYM